MKQIIDKLQEFITKLLILLELDIDALEDFKGESTMHKKRIADTLDKLVSLLTQLQKISQLEDNMPTLTTTKEDEAIIQQFLARNKKGD